MQIEAIRVALPSKRVTNEDVLELVREESRHKFEGDLDYTLRRIRSFLRYAGSENRNMLAAGETPLALLTQAIDQTLLEANRAKSEIDLLVYVGVGRGFIEPAGAYLVAHALGFESVQCFDILDACNSWSRAVHLIQALFQTGQYRTAMIVNAEFSTSANGLGRYALTCDDEVAWTFPTYTIGEAATATILSAGGPTWEFRFRSRPDLADLCTIPVTGFSGYSKASERIGRNGSSFTSYGLELFEAATPELIKVFSELGPSAREAKAIFPHTASKRAPEDVARTLGVEEALFNIYPECGNVVSCAVPAGIAIAAQSGRIKRGDPLAAVVASAGMSTSAYSFVY